MTTERLQAGKMESVQHTNPEADVTSLLEMKTTTELCHQKCRRIQASSHNQAEMRILIYTCYIIIMGVGGGGGSTLDAI